MVILRIDSGPQDHITRLLCSMYLVEPLCIPLFFTQPLSTEHLLYERQWTRPWVDSGEKTNKMPASEGAYCHWPTSDTNEICLTRDGHNEEIQQDVLEVVTRWRGQVWVGEREERMCPSYSHSQIQEGDNGAMEDVFRK